jgi:hypothetical protein
VLPTATRLRRAAASEVVALDDLRAPWLYAARVERPETVYIGLRGPQLPSGHGGPTVVGVRDEAGDRTLRKHPDARILVDEFEWGYRGAGPGALAEAILADRLGFNPEPEVSTAYAREVVSGLESEFELPGREIDEWISRQPRLAQEGAG